jgi:hypothetical protein
MLHAKWDQVCPIDVSDGWEATLLKSDALSVTSMPEIPNVQESVTRVIWQAGTLRLRSWCRRC